MNIFLIIKYGLAPLANECGDFSIIEFGSYKGGSAIFMARIAKELYPGCRVYALDTYEGMPEVNADLDAHLQNDFSDTDITSFKQRISECGITNLFPVKGFFEDTFPELRLPLIALAHIDCDIYDSVVYATRALLNRMNVSGGGTLCTMTRLWPRVLAHFRLWKTLWAGLVCMRSKSRRILFIVTQNCWTQTEKNSFVRHILEHWRLSMQAQAHGMIVIH